MLEIVVFLVMLLFGVIFGSIIESNHYKSIKSREQRYLRFPVTTQRIFPSTAKECFVVSASVVLADDQYKRLSASLKSIFGGRLRAYESLLDRAHREAVLRIKEKAMAAGAKGVVHFRIESPDLDGDVPQKSTNGVEILAVATAYR